MPKRRPDHVPTRTCAVCRTAQPKRDMDRMVRRADGSVQQDATGRAPGRGTYVCHDPACREPARMMAAVKRALGEAPTPNELEVTTNAPT